jgi:hypothetical protein
MAVILGWGPKPPQATEYGKTPKSSLNAEEYVVPTRRWYRLTNLLDGIGICIAMARERW